MANKTLRRSANSGIEQRRIDKAVKDLRALVLGGHINILNGVGEYLLREFFDGDVKQALAQHRKEGASIASLVERANEFGMKPTGVLRAIPIHVQVRQIGQTLAEQLPVTHHVALLPVRDIEIKRLLARLAVDEEWTVQTLRAEIGKRQKPSAGGRPPDPPVQYLVNALHRPFESDETPLDDLEAGLDRIDQTEAKRLLGKLNQVRSHLDRLEKVLVRVNIQRARAAD
jgi:hypothetical protein